MVGQMCVACFARLPFNHGCENCDWVDIYAVGFVEPVAKVCIDRCNAHRLDAP